MVGGSWGVVSFGKYNTLNIITANLKGGKTAVKGGKIPPSPAPRNTLRSSFHQNFEETKGYSPGFFFRGRKKYVEKSNPSESKRKEKLNGTCFSCIAHLRTELWAFKVSYPLYI